VEVGKDVLEALRAMRWERDGVANGVEDPTQDDFDGLPGGVALSQLFDGNGL
jgi:hypothetical protein